MFLAIFMAGWVASVAAQETEAAGKVREALAALRERPSAESLETAERKLADLGEESLPALRDAVKSPNPAVVALAAKFLQKWGGAEEAKALFDALQANPAADSVAPCVRAMVAIDPQAAPERALRLLEHKLFTVRAAASTEIAGRLRPEHAAEVLRLSQSKRDDTRVRALGLLAAFSGDECIDRLIAALSDSFPEAAATASTALARSRHPQAQEKVDALIAQGYLDRAWGYACLAAAQKLAANSGPISLDPEDKKLVLLRSALGSKESFVAGAAAVLLSQIGYLAPEGEDASYLDREVPEALLRATAGGNYSRDYSSLLPHALRQLQLLSGDNAPRRAPEWAAWWLAHRNGFRAMRWSSRLPFTEGNAFALDWIRPGESPGRIRFTSEEPPATSALEEEYWLDASQAARLLRVLRERGARTDLRATPEAGVLREHAFEFLQGGAGRTLSWPQSQGGAEPPRTLGALLQEFRESHLWQLFPDMQTHADRAAFLRAERAWWSEENKTDLRALRLKGTILRALPSAPARTKTLGLTLLSAQPQLVSVLSREDLSSFVDIAIGEQESFEARIKAIELAAKLGNEKSNAKLADDLAAQPSSESRSLLRRLFSSLGAGTARRALDHAHPSVRASAAEAFAAFRMPGSAEPLLRLLEDAEIAVRRSAIYALGILGAPETLSAVIAADEPALREECCLAAGRIGGGGALPFLSRMLGDRDAAVRSAAVQGLAEMPEGAGVSLIAEIAFRDSEPELAGLAGESLLACAQEAALSSMRNRLEAENATLRRRAILFLAELRDFSSAKPLAALLRLDPKDAEALDAGSILAMRDLAEEKDGPALLEALASRGAEAAPRIEDAPERIEGLRAKEWYLRAAALRALRVACVTPYPRLTKHSPPEEWEKAYRFFQKFLRSRAEKSGQ